MENQIKKLTEVIHNITSLNTKIQSNKLSHVEVKALLELVDVRRKGYLDLSDVFDLIGNVSEN